MTGKFNPKIALLGSGMIGGTLGLIAGLKKFSSNIIALDIADGLPQGKALDLSQAFAAEGIACPVGGSSDMKEGLKDADVVIVTAGFPRKEGMSRDDLVQKNAMVISGVAEAIKASCPNAFVVCITNPLDVMVALLKKVSGLPGNRVVGMAGILDASRFKFFLADRLGVSPRDVSTLVMGGHGDEMVPLQGYTSISGVPLNAFVQMGQISQQEVDEIIQRTRVGGGEIVKLLKMGSAFVAPAIAALQMVEAYLKDEKRLLPCCAELKGEYGRKDMYGGVPVIIGANGVEQVVELPLTAQEKEMFDKSMDAVQALKDTCTKLGYPC